MKINKVIILFNHAEYENKNFEYSGHLSFSAKEYVVSNRPLIF